VCAARALTAWPPRGKRGHVLFAWPRAVARDIRDDITHRNVSSETTGTKIAQGGDLFLLTAQDKGWLRALPARRPRRRRGTID